MKRNNFLFKNFLLKLITFGRVEIIKKERESVKINRSLYFLKKSKSTEIKGFNRNGKTQRF